MDLIDRLKYFMETENIASSQFADTCKIPRPTVSQILNRRNKTISDELIGKIHSAFPQISISWLLFGEGNMEVPPNIEISEPKNPDPNAIELSIAPDYQTHSTINEFPIDSQNFPLNNFRDTFTAQNNHSIKDSEQTKPTYGDQPERISTPISFTPQARKRITNIVVFYDDSSFESFMPSTQYPQ